MKKLVVKIIAVSSLFITIVLVLCVITNSVSGFKIGSIAFIKDSGNKWHKYNIKETTIFSRNADFEFKIKYSKVLGEFESLKSIDVLCDSKSDLLLFYNNTELESLTLWFLDDGRWNDDVIIDISYFPSNLKNLNIYNLTKQNLKFIETNQSSYSLETLWIENLNSKIINNFSVFSGCINLSDIKLNCRYGLNLEGIEKISRLKKASLISRNLYGDLNLLSNCKNLSYLSISVSNTDVLMKVLDLKSVDFLEINDVKGDDYLHEIGTSDLLLANSGIDVIYITGFKIVSPDVFLNMPNLKELYIGTNASIDEKSRLIMEDAGIQVTVQ